MTEFENYTAKQVRDETLEKAALVLEQNGWCQYAFARHENGNPIGPLEENAVCFCVLGAIKRVVGGENCMPIPLEFYSALEHAIDLKKQVAVSLWNDRYAITKENVIAMLHKAKNSPL